MNKPDIGEQAISKAAELGLKSQLDEVEALDVNIETDPLELAQGRLDSVTIDGKGIVMNQDLRAERMILHTDSIEINPLKAALGNIELEQNTNAEAKVVLLEADIQRAFNSEYIQGKLQDQQIELDGEELTVNARNVKFTIPDRDRLALEADIIITNETTETISLSAQPTVDSDANQVVLKDIEYGDRQHHNVKLAQALIDSVQEILDLSNFDLKGIDLQVNRIEIMPGKIIIAGSAVVKEFPSEP